MSDWLQKQLCDLGSPIREKRSWRTHRGTGDSTYMTPVIHRDVDPLWETMLAVIEAAEKNGYCYLKCGWDLKTRGHRRNCPLAALQRAVTEQT